MQTWKMKKENKTFSWQATLGVNSSVALGPIGEVWTTYSDVGDFRFGVIFAAAMENTYIMGPTKAFGLQVLYILYIPNILTLKLS